MQTVEIVAIVAAAVGLVVVAYLLRKRLTRLTVRFGQASAEIHADPGSPGSADPTLAGKGALIDDTKMSGTGVKVTDSTLLVRRSKFKDSEINVSERSHAESDG